MLDDIRLLYVHAGLPGELVHDGWRPGAVEAVIGKTFRAMDIHADEQSWRRVWAAYSATRTLRKPIVPLEQNERHVRDWIEWGMRQ